MNIQSSESLARTRLKAIECLRDHDAAQISFGAPELDGRLRGGLPQAALHEIYASAADAASGAAFALLLARRNDGTKPIFWVREARAGLGTRPYGHGLAELGIPPDGLFLVDAPDCIAALRAGADIIRCGAVGAVIIEVSGKAPAIDLTASRRLARQSQPGWAAPAA